MLHLSFHNRFQTGSQIHKQARQVNDSTASLSLAERWTITEIRRQSNSVLTYSLLTDVLRYKV